MRDPSTSERAELKTHKDLDVWKHALDLAQDVYQATREFPKEELYGLTMQVRRAAVSIACNIAEGAARRSKKEFVQFLYIALGSSAELETQLLLAERMGFLSPSRLLTRIERVRMMLLGLLRFLKADRITHHASRITAS
jgi:four helix bundle protein